MSNNNAQLERIKSLINYGTVNEEASRSNYTLVESKKAADGITYGIVKENHNFYIKTATNGRENIAEAYNYIGGWANHTDYQYSNLRAAEAALRRKIASIKEAHESEANIESLEPYQKELVYEGCTPEFKNQLARYRQLFKNTAAIMNESCEIGADRKDDVVMKDDQNCNGDGAKKGKRGDEEVCDKKAEEDKSGKKVPKGTKGVDKKVTPFDEEPKGEKNQIKEGCCDTDFDNGMDKGNDPKKIGWNIDGQQQVNEEEDFAAGLPESAGIGEADTDHNMPFDKGVNEGCCVEGDDEMDVEGLEEEPEEDEEFSEDDFASDEEPEFDEEEGEEDFDDEPEFDEDSDEDFEDDEEPEFEVEDEEEPEFDDEEGEEDFGDEEEPEFDDEEPEFDEDGDEYFGEEDFEDEEEPEFDDEEGEEDFGDEEEFAGEEDECGMNPMMEAKQRKMNSIVESVVKRIMNEDELHDFGKHPGYRKKPMELPATGEDKNQWAEDWNDESVYSEEPFGQKIGSSFPFEDFVSKVTDDVMYQLKSGEAFKKKA